LAFWFVRKGRGIAYLPHGVNGFCEPFGLVARSEVYLVLGVGGLGLFEGDDDLWVNVNGFKVRGNGAVGDVPSVRRG
jgi:hypothetical protein